MDSVQEQIHLDGGSIAVAKEVPRKKFSITSAIDFPLLLIMFGVQLSSAPITNLIMYRTCVHSLSYPSSDCRVFLKPGSNNVSEAMEESVQKYATFVTTVKSVLESLIPAMLSLFMVVWSDKHGRKPLLVLPILGMTLSSMMTVVYSMVPTLGPWWFLASSVPYSLTGGFSIMVTGALCYVTDVTTEKNRSLRLMLIQTTFAVGFAAGSLASPYLIRNVGNVYLLLIVTALYTVGYSFTIVFIEESITNAEPGTISRLLDPSCVTEMFRECFKYRPNRMRAQILLLTAAVSLSSFTLYGISGLEYLYTRAVLGWGLKQYTNFSATSTVISFVGSFVGVAILQRFLPIGDLTFSIVAFMSTTAEYYIKGFATLSFQMYFGSLVSFFGALAPPLIRSFVTKILPAEDVAKVFALMCAFDGLNPLLAPVVYNAVYSSTLYSLPGTIYLMSSCISILCAVMLGFVAFIRWNPTSSPYQIFHNSA